MRPIGLRMIEILEILEQSGPLTCAEIWAEMDLDKCDLIRHKTRQAADMGLAVRHDTNPAKYSAAEGWRQSPKMPKKRPELVDTSASVKLSLKSRGMVSHTQTPAVNFVFNLGAR